MLGFFFQKESLNADCANTLGMIEAINASLISPIDSSIRYLISSFSQVCIFLFQKQPPTVPCIVGSISCWLSVALPASRLGFQGRLDTLDLSCLSAGAGGVGEQIHPLHGRPSQFNLSCLNSSCYHSVVLLAGAI